MPSKYYEYQLRYRKNYHTINLMYDSRKPKDMAVWDALNKLPVGSKQSFCKEAISKALVDAGLLG